MLEMYSVWRLTSAFNIHIRADITYLSSYDQLLVLASPLIAFSLHRHLQQATFPLSPEARQMASRNKSEMLRTALECYRRAGECEESLDEPWLQHYMLGKISEKLRLQPDTYLRHYQQVGSAV